MKPRAKTDFGAYIAKKDHITERDLFEQPDRTALRKIRSKSTAFIIRRSNESVKSICKDDPVDYTLKNSPITEIEAKHSILELTRNRQRRDLKSKTLKNLDAFLSRKLKKGMHDIQKDDSCYKPEKIITIQPMRLRDAKIKLDLRNVLSSINSSFSPDKNHNNERKILISSLLTEYCPPKLQYKNLVNQEILHHVIRKKIRQVSYINQSERLLTACKRDEAKSIRDAQGPKVQPQITVFIKEQDDTNFNLDHSLGTLKRQSTSSVMRARISRKRMQSFNLSQERSHQNRSVGYEHTETADAIKEHSEIKNMFGCLDNKSILDTSVGTDNSVHKNSRKRSEGDFILQKGQRKYKTGVRKQSLDASDCRHIDNNSVLTETSTDAENFLSQFRFRKRHKLFEPDIRVFQTQLKLQDQKLKERSKYDQLLNRDIRPVFEKLHTKMDGYLVNDSSYFYNNSFRRRKK